MIQRLKKCDKKSDRIIRFSQLYVEREGFITYVKFKTPTLTFQVGVLL